MPQEPYRLFTDPIGILLILYSIAVLALIVERLLAKSRAASVSRGFVFDAQRMLQKGDRGEIQAWCQTSVAPPGRILAYVLGHEVRNSPETTEKLVDDALADEAARLRKRLVLLACLAGTAPFLGLLGTVVGIINTFESIMESGVSSPATISFGIARALQTTAAGLAIAIPAFIAYNLLANKANLLARKFETQANRILIAMGEL
jgi:biopolymer transport protein ExbB